MTPKLYDIDWAPFRPLTIVGMQNADNKMVIINSSINEFCDAIAMLQRGRNIKLIPSESKIEIELADLSLFDMDQDVEPRWMFPSYNQPFDIEGLTYIVTSVYQSMNSGDGIPTMSMQLVRLVYSDVRSATS